MGEIMGICLAVPGLARQMAQIVRGMVAAGCGVKIPLLLQCHRVGCLQVLFG